MEGTARATRPASLSILYICSIKVLNHGVLRNLLHVIKFTSGHVVPFEYSILLLI